MVREIKRGLSPVIATVLLVAMVVVIGLILFLWLRGFNEETITKFGGQNVKIVCDDVFFEASYSSGSLFVSNSGNVPIFGFEVKVQGDGSYSIQDLRDSSTSWPEAGLNQGGVFSEAISFQGTGIVLTPVLLGESQDTKKTHVCNEAQHGVSISI